MLALALNFLMIAGALVLRGAQLVPGQDGEGACSRCLPRSSPRPLLAVGVAYLYHRVGLAAIALFGIVLFTFQYLLGQLLLSEQRAEELERRGKQLTTRTRAARHAPGREC